MAGLGRRRTARVGVAASLAAISLAGGIAGASADEDAPACVPGVGASCAGADLGFGTLAGADLRGADLRGANLGGALLHGAALGGSDLRGADLRAATLTAANMEGVHLAGANLADANLEYASLGLDALEDASLCRTQLSSGEISSRDCDAPAPAAAVPAGSAVATGATDAFPAPAEVEAAPLAPTGSEAAARLDAEKPKRRRVRLKVEVAGAGRVVSGRARLHGERVAKHGRIDCPGKCVARFPAKSRLALKAAAQEGYEFTGWSGKATCKVRGDTCRLRIARPKRNHATATFAPTGDDAVHPVCQEDPARDMDGDGLTDCVELTGWALTVSTPSDLSGSGVTRREVSTDPSKPDTDGDGVADKVEFEANSDPTRLDGDADGLPDRDEIDIFRSLPNSADSDNDSLPPNGGAREPRMFDRSEALDLETNPRIPDTDGDSITDYVEVIRELTNPRVPDLPQVDLVAVPGLSNPQLDLDYTVEETTGTEKESSSVTQRASTVEHSTETSRESTYAHTREWTAGVKCTISKDPGCTVSGSYTNSVTNSVTNGSTSGFSNSAETSQEFGEIARRSAERKVILDPTACMQVILRLANNGPVAVSAGNLQVLALSPSPSDPNDASLLAALLPIEGQEISDDCPATAPNFGPVELAPGAHADVAFSQQIDSDVLLAYESSPTPLQYELGVSTMKGTNLGGQPVDFLSEVATKVKDRTASIEIDFGDGEIVDFGVAAQARIGADGRPQGVTLGEALGAGLGDLAPSFTGGAPSKIDALRNPASGAMVANQPDPRNGVWTLFGDAEGVGDDAKNWQDVVLRPGNTVSVKYVRDSDADNLPDGYEGLVGTDPQVGDTDADGATCVMITEACPAGTSSDYFETQIGWEVPFARGSQSSYKVYPSPLACDADADDSPDGPGPGDQTYGDCPNGLGPEATRLTDPTRADTNSDGQLDGAQELPDALRAIPEGGRMPVLVRTWGGQANFSKGRPMGIAVDPNQPLFDEEGQALPVDSYVTVLADDMNEETGDVYKFTGNPRVAPPVRGPLMAPDPEDFAGGPVRPVGVGIDVAEGTVGTGDDEGSPVVVNYYPRDDLRIDPGAETNLITTFNGTTREDLFDPASGFEPPKVAGRYGFDCCFGSPIFDSDFRGNGFIDSAGPGQVMVGHGTGGLARLGRNRGKALPTLYRGGDGVDLMTRYGEQAQAVPQAQGEFADPTGVAVDTVANKLYAADEIVFGQSMHGAITRFDIATGQVEEFVRDDEAADLSWVRGLSLDADGRYLYAVASGGECGRLLKLSPSLSLLGRLDLPHGCQPTHGGPEDVDVDAANGIWLTQPVDKLIRFYFFPFGP